MTEGVLGGDHGFESRLAVVSAVFLGIGWAVVTGAQSGLLGRLGFFAVGAATGLAVGYRSGAHYVDSSPRVRRLLRVSGYLFIVVVTALAVSPGDERVTVRGALAGVCFGPTLWALLRNILSDRGNRGSAVRIVPWALVGSGLVFLASEADGWTLAAVLGALVMVSLVAVGLDLQRRVEQVEPEESQPTPPLPRGSVWMRAAGAGACLLLAVSLATRSHHAGDEQCGTVRRALDFEPGHPCERPLRVDTVSGLLLLHGAALLVYPVLRRPPLDT